MRQSEAASLLRSTSSAAAIEAINIIPNIIRIENNTQTDKIIW